MSTMQKPSSPDSAQFGVPCATKWLQNGDGLALLQVIYYLDSHLRYLHSVDGKNPA